MVAVQPSGHPANHLAERTDQRRRPALGDRDRQIPAPACRGDLGTGKACADDEDPPGPACESPEEVCSVGPYAEHPVIVVAMR